MRLLLAALAGLLAWLAGRKAASVARSWGTPANREEDWLPSTYPETGVDDDWLIETSHRIYGDSGER